MDESPRFGGAPGTLVPEVDPEDLKAVWELHREVQARHSGEGLVAVAGADSVCKPGADIQAVSYRLMLLGAFIHICEEGKLAPSLLKDGQLSDAIFNVAARMRAEWIGDKVYNGFPFDVDELFRLARGEGEQPEQE